MKILNILSLATAAMAAVACSNRDLVGENASSDNATPATRTVVVTANSPQNAATRASYTDADSKMLWQKGDTLALIVKNSSGGYEKVNLTLRDGAGTASAEFMGTLTSDQTPLRVVYPAYAYKSYNGSKWNFTFPTTRTYTQVGEEFYENANSCNMYASCDVAATDENASVIPLSADLKYLCGVLAIKVPYLPSDSGSVIISSDKYLINGDMNSYTGKNGEELGTNVYSKDAQLHDTISYSGATAGGAGVFYFPVPTSSTYASTFDYTLTATVEGTVDGKTKRYDTSAHSLAVAKGQIKNITLEDATDGNYSPAGFSIQISKNVYQSDTDKYLYAIKGRADGSSVTRSSSADSTWYEMVDLGVTTEAGKKVLFATMNIGAKTVTDYGSYYAWGETSTKSSYSDDAYTGFPTNVSGTLPNQNDAAYVNWGSSFRMPTNDEFSKIFDSNNFNCEWISVQTSGGSSVNGCKVTNNTTGSSIFFPAAGLCSADGSAYSCNEYGGYWSSTISGYDNSKPWAWSLSIYSKRSDCKTATGNGRFGHTIRPVAEI